MVGDKGRRAKPSPAFSLGSIGRACIFYSALVCSKGRRFGKGRGWFDYIAGWTRLQSRPPTGIGGVHGRSKALKGVVVCSNKRARQPFGNDRLFSLLGFGNVMFDSVGCVQQPRWGRLVRWRLATTFPPVRLLARGPVFSRRLKWLVTVTSRG